MSPDSANFQTLMNKGHSAAWDQDWEKAAEAYKLALADTPDHPQALASLGLAYFQLKKYDDALQLYQRLSAINPEDPMPFEKIGRINERNGALQEAVQSFMQAAEMQLKGRDVDRAIFNFNDSLRLNPENQTAHTRLAVIFDKLGRKTESVVEYISVAALMQKKGDVQKAVQVAEYALQLVPDSQDARNAVALLKGNQRLPMPERKKGGTGPVRMSQVRQMEAAETEKARTVYYDPLTEARLAGLKEMAGLLFESGEDSSQASAGARRGLQVLTRGTGGLASEQVDRARTQLHLSQAIDLLTAGQDEQAAVELDRAIDLGFIQSASFYMLALLINQKEPQKALKNLQKSVRKPAYTLASYLLMGNIYERTKQYKEASVNYLQALKMADAETVDPRDADELMQLYEPIFETHLRVDSEKDLRNLCSVINGQLSRSDWRTYLKAAREQLPSQAEGSPPVPLAEMLMETTSSQVIDSLGVIRKLAAEGKLRTAMEEAYHALSYAPTYLPLHIQMGELLISEGRTMEAVEKFLQVSNLYTIRGEVTQAIRLLSKVTRLAPMDLSVRSNLIDLLKSIGRMDDAIQQYMDLANVYYLLADLDLARQTYQTALALSRQSSTTKEWTVNILNKLADIELQSLDWKQAVKVFEQLRNLEPMEPNPRATLIDLYLRMGMANAAMNELEAYLNLLSAEAEDTKAEKFIDQLLAERPENTELQKRMVNLLVKRNQMPKAVEKLDALAEKLMGIEDHEGALNTLQVILSLNPPNAADYQKLYDSLKTPSQPGQ